MEHMKRVERINAERQSNARSPKSNDLTLKLLKNKMIQAQVYKFNTKIDT